MKICLKRTKRSHLTTQKNHVLMERKMRQKKKMMELQKKYVICSYQESGDLSLLD